MSAFSFWRNAFHHPLTITWYYGPTVNGPWYEAGQSSNQVYVLLGAPQTAPLYHTLVHLGCENAKGETTPEGAIPKIWEEFTDRSVVRVNTSASMQYYGPRTSQNLDPLPSDFFTTAGLLEHGDGRCSAWANLFVDILKTQGIVTASLKEIRTKDVFTIGLGRGFWVRSFIEGQGPNEHPSIGPFASHAVVMIDNALNIYDPSYGRFFPNLVKWEDLIVQMFKYSHPVTENEITDGNTLGDEQTYIH